MCPPRPPEIWRKAQKSIVPDGTTRGLLQIQEEGSHASENEGDITYHQYEFENNPQNRYIYGEELQQLHDEDKLLLGFVNINGLKEET